MTWASRNCVNSINQNRIDFDEEATNDNLRTPFEWLKKENHPISTSMHQVHLLITYICRSAKMWKKNFDRFTTSTYICNKLLLDLLDVDFFCNFFFQIFCFHSIWGWFYGRYKQLNRQSVKEIRRENKKYSFAHSFSIWILMVLPKWTFSCLQIRREIQMLLNRG